MLPTRTLNTVLLVVAGIGMVAAGLARSTPVAGQDDADADVQAKIAAAVSAAPASIATDAAVYDAELDAAGEFVVLREGDNGWTCFPDAPGTPGNDPQCLDQTWLDWLLAYIAGEEPNVTAPGFAYMLQGGSDPSNTDPFATEPAAGEDWVTSPAHIMLIVPEELDQSAFSTDHESGLPYVMYAGTPYEHLMIPVAAGDHEG
jgi:hypothetical protein